MISINNISKNYKDKFLFKDISFTIKNREKIAIIGDNGVGKTTLLKILIDPDLATDGQVNKGDQTVGYLSQKVIENDQNTIEEEMGLLFKELKNINLEMEQLLVEYEQTQEHTLIERYGELESTYSARGGYHFGVQVEKMVSAFGFNKEDIKKKIKRFSGGEQTKIALVKLLLTKPDYLLLDEPTNHLDIETIKWLEKYLQDYEGTVVVVSHDRYFIDKVCTKIIEIEQNKLFFYTSNYTNYLIEKEKRYNVLLATYENQQKEIQKLEDFITKFRGKPSKIGQVNDRKSKLERIELIDKPIDDKQKIHFSVSALHVKKTNYIELKDLYFGYDSPLSEKLTLPIRGGERIGIIGENGIGKTTLLKTILKQIEPISGSVKISQKIKIGYFDQKQQLLKEDKTIFEAIKELMDNKSDLQIRKHLANFLFKGSDIFKIISSLSGGERVRVILSYMALQDYDVIVLDEPTNHLDLKSKQVLEQAFLDYQGTILCVSHDRYFLNQIIDKFIYLQPTQLNVFSGEYNLYEQYMIGKEVKNKKKKADSRPKKINNNQVKKIEKKIEEVELEKQKLIKLATQKEIYSDFQKSNQIQSQINDLETENNKLLNEYEKLIEGE